MNKTTKVIIGFIVSTGLVIFLFYKIDFASVLQTILKFNAWVLLVLLAVYIIGMGLRTSRWQILIGQRNPISFLLVFKALVIGYMINNLFPAKVGELARMEYLKRKKGIGRSFLLGTIFMERLIDLMLVLLIFAFSLVFSQSGRTMFLHNKWIFLLMIILMAVSIYLMLRPGKIIRFLSLLPEKIRFYLEKVIRSFSESISFAADRKLLFWVSVYSLFIWALTLLTSFLILSGLDVYLPFYGYFFVIAVGVFGLVIPSTSGGIGVFHAIATTALLFLGVAPEKALAYAIIAHAFDFFPNVIIGFVISTYEGITLNKLSTPQATG
jgi:glycosyltransferase 2 family protein